MIVLKIGVFQNELFCPILLCNDHAIATSTIRPTSIMRGKTGSSALRIITACVSCFQLVSKTPLSVLSPIAICVPVDFSGCLDSCPFRASTLAQPVDARIREAMNFRLDYSKKVLFWPRPILKRLESLSPGLRGTSYPG